MSDRAVDVDGPADVPDQRAMLQDATFDVLVVLDAVRWDIWADMVGDGEPVWSPASCTIQWVPHLVRALGLGEVACISANPEVTRRTHDAVFVDRDDLWQRGWEYINGLGTVPQESVTEAVEARLTVGPDTPVYAHYPGAHGPYPKHDPPVGVMRNNPYAADMDTDNIDDEYVLGEQIVMQPMQYVNDDDHWLSADVLESAYRSNVEWAWESIQPLLEGDERVVVTADHGEFLADEVSYRRDDGDGGRETETDRVYGHPCGVSHPLLRRVPWVVYD